MQRRRRQLLACALGLAGQPAERAAPLAVGDAAMSFDPLSSDGISKGLEWGRKAAALAAAFCRGDRLAAPAYRQALNEVFSDYLATRHRYYTAERRWPQAPFWRRRQVAPRPIH